MLSSRFGLTGSRAASAKVMLSIKEAVLNTDELGFEADSLDIELDDLFKSLKYFYHEFAHVRSCTLTLQVFLHFHHSPRC